MINIIKNKHVKNGLWLYTLNFLQMALSLFTFPFITRILGTENYGFFNIAFNLISYMEIIIAYGFDYTGTRKIAKANEDEYSEIYSRILCCKLILLGVCIVIICFICNFSEYNNRVCLCLYIMIIALIGMALQQTWFFTGVQNMKYITICNVIARVISVILIFLLIRTPEHIYLYSFLYSSTYLISGIFSVIICHKVFHLRFYIKEMTSFFRSIKNGFNLFLTSAMSKTIVTFGSLLVGIYASSSEVGVYYAISKIPNMIILMFTPIKQVMFPYFSSKFEENKNIALINLKKIMAIILPVIILLGVIIIITGKRIIVILCGEEYVEGYKYLYYLIPWVFFTMVNNFLGVQNLVARGYENVYRKIYSIYCIFSIVLNIFVVREYGCVGACVCLLVSEVFFSILLFGYCKLKMRYTE